MKGPRQDVYMYPTLAEAHVVTQYGGVLSPRPCTVSRYANKHTGHDVNRCRSVSRRSDIPVQNLSDTDEKQKFGSLDSLGGS